MEKSANMFAAVKFISDTNYCIVSVDEIENFIIADNYPDPLLVKRKNRITGDEEFEPAQILATSNSYEELQNNEKRYKFKRIRKSDALELLATKAQNFDKYEKSSMNSEKKNELINTEKKSEKSRKCKKKGSTKNKTEEDLMNDDILKTKFGFDLQVDVDSESNDNASEAIEELNKQIRDKNETIEELHVTVENLKSLQKENDVKIEQLLNEIAEEKAITDARNRKLEKKNKKIIKLKEKLQQLQETIEGFKMCEAGISKTISSPTAYKPIPGSPDIANCSFTSNCLKSSTPKKNLMKEFDKPPEVDDTFYDEMNDTMSNKQPIKTSNKSDLKNKSPTNIEKPVPKKIKLNEREHSNEDNKLNDDDDCGNDEDAKNGTLESFKSWSDTSTGRTIKKFHLCDGISIHSSEWKLARKKESPSQFVRFLAEALWGSTNLMNRALDVSKVTAKLPNRSPVKPCTPKKLAVLEKSYHYFLQLKDEKIHETLKSLPVKERTKILKEWRVFLKLKINSLRKGKCKNASTSKTKEVDESEEPINE